MIGQGWLGYGSGVVVFLGRADGSLGKGTAYAAGQPASYVAVGDVNHDGKLDIIAANALTASLEILPGNGDGTFRVPTSVSLPGIPRGIVVADFNGDGWPDVAVAGSGGAVYILLNDRKGSLGRQRRTPFRAAGLSWWQRTSITMGNSIYVSP